MAKTTRKKQNDSNNTLQSIGTMVGIIVGLITIIGVVLTYLNKKDTFPIPNGNYELVNEVEYKRNIGKIFGAIKENYTLPSTITVADTNLIAETNQGKKIFPINIDNTKQCSIRVIDWLGKQNTITVDYSETQGILKFYFPSGTMIFQKK